MTVKKTVNAVHNYYCCIELRTKIVLENLTCVKNLVFLHVYGTCDGEKDLPVGDVVFFFYRF